MNVNNKYLFGATQIRQMSLRKINPVGITIHNTANTASAHNEAANVYNNNTKRGIYGVAIHYFIDESTIYRNVPDNYNGWHASDGVGFGNMRTISIEICRSLDYSTDRYVRAEKRAAEFTAMLMKKYNIPISKVKRHYDYSPHGKRCPHRMFESRPTTWPKFLNMVNGHLNNTSVNPKPVLKSNSVIAAEVWKGLWGNGLDRINRLTKAGYDHKAIQVEVDKQNPSKPSQPKPKPVLKSNSVIAAEVWKGLWGNGSDRINRLTKAGYNPKAVQVEVDKQNPKNKPKPSRKSNKEIALEIYRGVGGWGNNPGRKQKLEAAGYNYSAVQAEVNKLL